MRQVMKILMFDAMLTPTVGFSQTDFETRLALAEKGDVTAQYNLGVMHANGEGVSQDDAEAVKWNRLAAEQGLSSAQYPLGAITFQLAEVDVTAPMVRAILAAFRRLRAPPLCA